MRSQRCARRTNERLRATGDARRAGRVRGAVLALALLCAGAAWGGDPAPEVTFLPGDTSVRSLRAQWQGNTLILRGRVVQFFRSRLRVEVETSVFAPGGRLIRTVCAKVFPTARRGRGRRWRTFSVRVPLAEVPKEGVWVRVDRRLGRCTS